MPTKKRRVVTKPKVLKQKHDALAAMLGVRPVRKSARRVPPNQELRLAAVLRRLHAYVANLDARTDADEIQQWSSDLDVWLNELSGQDAFGTEGQNDPRGDQRNGSFTTRFVEGLDK